MLLFVTGAFAKDIKTVVLTTNPQMHCEGCETKIKSNIRFEKGVKQIETDIPNQKVTVEYDAEKTNPEKIQEGFKKIGYETEIIEDESVSETNN